MEYADITPVETNYSIHERVSPRIVHRARLPIALFVMVGYRPTVRTDHTIKYMYDPHGKQVLQGRTDKVGSSEVILIVNSNNKTKALRAFLLKNP